MYSQISWYTLKTLKDSFLNQTKRMDTNSQEIISRLKFIGSIKKGDKINTRHLYIQPAGMVTSFSRTLLYPDSRSNTIDFCIGTIKRSYELLITYERSQNKSENQIYLNIIGDLKNALIGIENLKGTYIDDNKFCCDMDTLLEEIRAKLDHEFTKMDSKVNDSNEE
jgi:hypothetical protein